MQLFELMFIRFLLVSHAAKDVRRIVEQLPAPVIDLVRVDIIVLCNLGQGLVALQRGQRNFGLEGRLVITSFASDRVCSCSWVTYRSEYT